MTWLLVAAILIAGFLVARAIEQSRPIVNTSSQQVLLSTAEERERHAVANIAAQLISAAMNHDTEKRLDDDRQWHNYRFSVAKITGHRKGDSEERKIQVMEAEDQLAEAKKFALAHDFAAPAVRERYINIAWGIYRDVKSTQADNTQL